MSDDSFDPGAGFLGGFNAGYALDGFRIESEYLNRSHDGDSSRWDLGGNAALESKNNEVSTLDPPSERISDFNARQFFLSAYYDFPNDSRWTPYVGGGVGWSVTSLNDSNRFIRKTLAQGYPTDGFSGASGTISYWDDDVSKTLFGFQFMEGAGLRLHGKNIRRNERTLVPAQSVSCQNEVDRTWSARNPRPKSGAKRLWSKPVFRRRYEERSRVARAQPTP